MIRRQIRFKKCRSTKENTVESMWSPELDLQQYDQDRGRGLDLVGYAIWKSVIKSMV